MTHDTERENNLNNRLAKRIIKLVFSIYFSIAFTTTLIQLYTEYDHEKRGLEEEIYELQHVFGSVVAESIFHQDIDITTNAMNSILSSSAVLGIRLSGDVNMSFGSIAEETKQSYWDALFYYFSEPKEDTKHMAPIVYKFPITYEDHNGKVHQVGQLNMYTSQFVIFYRSERIFSITIINAIVKSIFLCLIMYLIIKKMVALPLEELTKNVRTMSSKKYFGIDLIEQLNRDDEIGELANSFKNMTQRLRETTVSRDQYDLILRSMRDAVAIVDKLTCIDSSNKSLSDLSGYDDFKNSEIYVSKILEEPTIFIGKKIDELFENGYLNSWQTQLRNKNGKIIPVLISAAAIYDENGTDHAVIVFHDITEITEARNQLLESHEKLEERVKQRTCELDNANTNLKQEILLHKQTTKELEKMAEAAQEASRIKSEFLATMSHELRTPLNSQLILAEVLAENTEGNLTNDQIYEINMIYESGHDLLMIINDILDLSKAEAGKLEFVTQEVDIGSMISDIKEKLLPIAQQKNLYLKSEIDTNSPKHIYSDQTRIQQILRNFISNALKFTHEGGVIISVKRPNDKSRGDIEFSVKDTGVGIAEDKKEFIFEAFSQVDGALNRKFAGTGLGLSIARQFSIVLGGKISIESQLNKGSTFSLYLPISKQSKELADAIA